MLKVASITKHYRDTVALSSADLAIEPGEILALLGSNGAGKSTLTNIIAGVIKPDEGEVWIDGTLRRKVVERSQETIGYVPQEIALYPTLTVRENMLFFAELQRVPASERKRRIDDAAEALGLTTLMHRTADGLSGGEARRLHVSIALLHRPRLLLLDEPTVAADVQTRQRLLDLVRELAADGAAILYTTHYLPEVEDLDSRVAVLDHGRIIAQGSIAELVARCPGTAVEFTFRDAASVPCLPGTAVTGEGKVLRVELPDGPAQVPRLLGDLGPLVEQIEGLQILRPNLEAAFLAITSGSSDTAGDGPAEGSA